MKKSKKIVAGVLCLILLCAAAGCGGPASKDVADSFTLEDLERCNAFDVVFEDYGSARIESKFYDFDLPGGDRGDFTQTSVFVKGDSGVSMYTDFSFGFAYAVEGRNVYQRDENGSYSVLAFFDDGYYEEAYLPTVSKWILYVPTEGEELISSSVTGGVRNLVTNTLTSDVDDYTMWGIEGIVDTNYELDAESGLLLKVTDYLTGDDGNRRLLAEAEIRYGQDDGFTPPEYVTLCKDTTETRTVHFVRDPGTAEEKTFTFTLPKKAALHPAAMEEFELYKDPEFTVLLEEMTGEFPDEATLYMKQK